MRATGWRMSRRQRRKEGRTSVANVAAIQTASDPFLQHPPQLSTIRSFLSVALSRRLCVGGACLCPGHLMFLYLQWSGRDSLVYCYIRHCAKGCGVRKEGRVEPREISPATNYQDRPRVIEKIFPQEKPRGIALSQQLMNTDYSSTNACR